MERKVFDKVVKAINGDKSAYGDLYEIYALEMYKYALYICKNREDAEDAVQETALAVFKSIRLLKDPSKFKSYLFSSLANCCKKKYKGYETLELNENTVHLEGKEDEKIAVWTAMDKLDSESREIVSLSVLSGFKSHEISDMLNLPAPTVRTKLRRALKKMGEELRV